MNGNYHIIRIQRYLDGELSKEEMYELEREALDDPLLQDAIDGYRMQREVSHRRLSLLQQRLAARIEGQAKEREAFFFGWQRLGVAATACVLMVLVLVLLWLRSQHLQPTVAEKEVAVALAPLAEVHAEAIGGDGAFDGKPVDGWQHFNEYLSERKRDLVSVGEIVLTFDIDPQGNPVSIRAIGKADAPLFEEATSLLENGPKWQGTKVKIMFSFQ